ncbi:UNVERIFIED_CONTAM: hypothetical protein GTU68_026673 [Idotea baltica]|nr:hypothetical protein [Idotea baltica]
MGSTQSEFGANTDTLSAVFSACDYSLSGGGKRVRPILIYASALAIEPNCELSRLDPIACAIEMVHTYSLVHDDLPAMDDDDLRRGRPSCHIAFGEAIAILAGDALHTRAFELLAEAPLHTSDQRLALIKTLSAAAGPRGMIGGQAIDIAVTGQMLNLQQLKIMHTLKTGALIQAGLTMGAISCGASEEQLHSLENYGAYIGLAFQVADDILDVEGSTEQLGKTQGKDSAASKATYVQLLGLEGAKQEAVRLLEAALDALTDFGTSADHLRDLAKFIVTRSH